MQIRRVLGFGLVALTTLAACGGGYLRWKARPAAPAVVGKIAILVNDSRPEKNPQNSDRRVVGMQPGFANIPTPIRLPTETEAAESVRDMLGQAALTAGIGVAPAGDPAPSAKVMVDMGYLWCTGFWPVFRAGLVAGITVIDPATNQPRTQPMLLKTEGGAGDCQSAHRDNLTKAYDAAVAMMASPEFKGAATGGGGMAPPPAQAAPPPAQ